MSTAPRSGYSADRIRPDLRAGVIARLLRSRHRDVALVDHYRTGMDGTVVSISGGVTSSVIPPHLRQEDFSFAGKYKTLNIYKLPSELCAGQLRQPLFSASRQRASSSAG